MPASLPPLSDRDFARFTSYIEESDLGYETPCQVWIGGRFTQGYGLFVAGGRNLKAHRVAWAFAFGDTRSGLDHLCHDPATCAGGFGCPHRACVNPAHLAIASVRENVLRGGGPSAANAAKTHCVNGHEFTRENTFLDEGGWRQCRQCARDRTARFREANRDAINAQRRANRQRIEHEPRPCAFCGAPFVPVRSTRLYCSNSCMQRAGYRRRHGL